MDLRTYLNAAPRGAGAQLARDLGVAPETVSQWKAGSKRPSIEHAIRVERITRGVVRVEDLRPDMDWSFMRRKARRDGIEQELAAA